MYRLLLRLKPSPAATSVVGGHAKKMKIKIAILLTFLSIKTFGTAQIPDRLIYKGDTLALFYCPLELHPDQELSAPKNLFESKGCFYTACWRNYVATWSIENNSLYLLEIRNACYPTNQVNVEASFKSKEDSIGNEYADLKKLFPDKYENGKVKADWVNGNMIAPKGKLLYYFHDGFESVYEEELELKIVDGELVHTKTYDNSKTRQAPFTQNPELLYEFITENLNKENLPKSDTIKRKVFVQIISTNDQGKVDSVEVVHGVNELYDKEAIRLIKEIPEWDVIYRHGEKVEMKWVVPIVFNVNK